MEMNNLTFKIFIQHEHYPYIINYWLSKMYLENKNLNFLIFSLGKPKILKTIMNVAFKYIVLIRKDLLTFTNTARQPVISSRHILTRINRVTTCK